MARGWTNREQGDRLLAAGVPVDSVDMFAEGILVYKLPMGVDYLTYAGVMAESWRIVRPVWSIEALWTMQNNAVVREVIEELTNSD